MAVSSCPNNNYNKDLMETTSSPLNPGHALPLSTVEFSFDDHVFAVDATDFQDPRFRLQEVCDYLGYVIPRKAVEKLCPDPRDHSYAVIQTKGGPQKVRMISEAGLYALVFNSKMPKAREFRDKVYREILPSIRKTGEYQTERLKTERGVAGRFFYDLQEAVHTSPQRQDLSMAKAMVQDLQRVSTIPMTSLMAYLEHREFSAPSCMPDALPEIMALMDFAPPGTPLTAIRKMVAKYPLPSNEAGVAECKPFLDRIDARIAADLAAKTNP